MKKLTFNVQLVIAIILILIGNILGMYFHNGILINIAWIIDGIIYIINPAYPEKYEEESKKAKLALRIFGVVCILIGIFIGHVV